MTTMAAKLSIAGLLVLACFITLNSAGVPRPADVVPMCPFDFVGNLTYPHNCVLYIECQKEWSTVRSCPDLKVFDPKTARCNSAKDHPECEDGGFIHFDFERRVAQV